MSTIRVEKKSYYTVISNVPLQKDTRLSAKAKGLLAVMLSFPDDWVWSVEVLAKYFSDGKESVRSGIKELEANGYILREDQKRQNGKLGRRNYILYEEPQDEENRTEIGLQEEQSKFLPSTQAAKPKEEKKSKYTEEISEIVSYLNEMVGASYRPSTAATKRAITARLKEGFSVDDFKTVIWRKTKQWANDPKMVQYLRPSTLFGNKFEDYLNEKEAVMQQTPPDSAEEFTKVKRCFSNPSFYETLCDVTKETVKQMGGLSAIGRMDESMAALAFTQTYKSVCSKRTEELQKAM